MYINMSYNYVHITIKVNLGCIFIKVNISYISYFRPEECIKSTTGGREKGATLSVGRTEKEI